MLQSYNFALSVVLLNVIGPSLSNCSVNMALGMWQKLQIFLAFVQSCSNPFDIVCPHKSHVQFRTQVHCNSTRPQYMCLYDENKKQYTEVCVEEAETQREGYNTILRGGIDGVPCSTNNYQPFSHSSNTGGSCAIVKTSCNDEGQLLYDDGSSTTDRSCRCDYRVGYDYVTVPSNKCFCKPAIEDCSCYMKYCDVNQVLTQDYKCARVYKLTGIFDCPEVSGLGSKDIEKNKKMPSNATKTGIFFVQIDYYQNKDKTYHGILDLILGIAIGMIIASVVLLSTADILNVVRLKYSHNDVIHIVCNHVETVVLCSIELKCHLESTRHCKFIYWTKRINGDISTITSRTPGIHGSTVTYPSLTLDSPLIEDCGEYVCCAVYDYGRVCSPPIRLTVTGDVPSFSVDNELHNTDIGKPVSLFCKIYANPPCSNVVWKKYEDGQYTTIHSDSIDCSQTKYFTFTLNLDTFMESDSGYYFCYATNIVGTSKSKCITLSERKYAPTIEVDVDDNYCFNKINEDVSMPYTVSANPPCTSVVWKKKGDGTSTTIYSEKIASSPSKHITRSFKLVNLKEKQSGEYFCVATNEVGTTKSQSVLLYVAEAEDDDFSSDENRSTVTTLPHRRTRYHSCPSNWETDYYPIKRRSRLLS
ncbi:TTN [Mytilus coruscus]|uniref:TTN n=1 Tax=Mytilus coruscus TaxID=42192 RepID=A0A6J8AZI5_MYTCO|nr:TTN [Mytilus coruscus]